MKSTVEVRFGAGHRIRRRYLSAALVNAVVLNAVVVAPVWAQEKQPDPAGRYPLPTFEENWQFLADSTARRDRWDGLKFIGFGEKMSTFLSLGGEGRETYERFGNQEFGLATPSPRGYWLQRYLLHADLHIQSRVRTWAEISSSLESGRVGGPRPVIDENQLDLHQAFVDLTLTHSSDSDVRARVGRQEIAIGSGRLYSLREGVNVPLSFDGARVTARERSWRLDAWAARPVQSKSGLFDDRSNQWYSVWGAYASRPVGAGVIVDTYYLGLDRQAARFDQGVGDETRHTVGVRAWRPGVWAFDAEGMYQFGPFGPGRIRAWRFVMDTARALPTIACRPRIGFDIDVASGDRDPADPDLQTFNSMFQSGIYSGRAQLLGPNNSIRLEPSLGLTPARGLVISMGWGFYWRQNEHDALYGIPGQVVVPSNGVPGRYEGSRPIAQIDWALTSHVSVHVNYIYVFNAEFERRSVHGTPTMSFVSPWITYRF